MKTPVSTLLIGLATTGAAHAGNCIDVPGGLITTSTTWTADNCYNLTGQVYIAGGATLTIEAGTVIASDTNVGGSLAVTRGSQIFALGEAGAPVIFTSSSDVATWDVDGSHPTGGDPRTGTWREAANEWGNLTIMGSAYISENAIPGNTPSPSASNVADMEGLQNGPSTDRYGGGDDDDDSGVLRHVSIRYGGRVIGLNNELNGLSLGGIGRGTDIDYVEIMNNVDDGIEVWGGTVGLEHVSIWNVGDDSLDIDQGWRGKAQFGLIVQGFSLDADQGSGVGDNALEHDGAEDCDWQPRTRGQIANFTVIGQPLDGDGLTAWRDNCGMQYYNCIFMDGGEALVRFDDDDGDGACGYSAANGTLSWAQHWTTPASQFPLVNEAGNPAAFYTAQRANDNICDIEDSVFFRNFASSAYTEADARGVRDASNNNVTASASPIASITRVTPPEVRGGKLMLRVTQLDPTPVNDAVTSALPVPADGFFAPVRYRGGFSPDTKADWLCGWTASNAYGFTGGDCIGENFTDSNPNETGQIGQIRAYGSATVAQNDVCLEATDLPRQTFGFFLNAQQLGFIANPGGSLGNILLGGTIGRFQQQIANSGLEGIISLQLDLSAIPRPNAPGGFTAVAPGDTWCFQLWSRDSSGGVALSNFTNAICIDFQ